MWTNKSMLGSVSQCVALVATAAWFVALQVAVAQPESGLAEPETETAEQSVFVVPDGTAEELLAYIERIANPTTQFETNAQVREYLSAVSPAIVEAAEKIVAGEATDIELIDAIEWKIKAFQIARELGDRQGDKKIDSFLAGLEFGSRPAVERKLEELRTQVVEERLVMRLQRWRMLSAAQRNEFLEQFRAFMTDGDITPGRAGLLLFFGDAVSDSPHSKTGAKLIEELLPRFRNTGIPAIEERLPRLEGLLRRLNLPGSKIELSGTLLDGTTLDWESYRGKVVLVDYWASWCGPCQLEIPNVMENYRAYHDQGFEVLGICLDDDRQVAEQHIQQTGLTWPSLFSDDPDATGWDHPMAVKYAVTGIPRAILVDQNGIVVSMNARGPLLGVQLRQLLGPPDGAGADETSSLDSVSEQRTASSATPAAR